MVTTSHGEVSLLKIKQLVGGRIRLVNLKKKFFNDGKSDVITDIMSIGKTWNGSRDSGCLSFESASYIQEIIGIWV